MLEKTLNQIKLDPLIRLTAAHFGAAKSFGGIPLKAGAGAVGCSPGTPAKDLK